MCTLTHHKKSVRAMARHPKEKSFASASADNIEFSLPKGEFLHNMLPTADLDEPRGQHMPLDAWRASSPSSVAPHQFNNFGPNNLMGLMGGTVTSTTDNGAFRSQMLRFLGTVRQLCLRHLIWA